MATKPIVQPNVSSGQSAVNSQPRRLPMVTRTPLFPPRTPTEPQPASQHTSSSTLNPQQTKPFQKPRAEATDPYTYGNNTAYYRLLTEIQNRDYENATKVSDGGKQDHVKWKGKEPQHERRGRERVLQAQGPTGTVFDTLVAQSPGRHFTGFGTFLSEQRYRYLQNLTRPDLKGTIVTDFQTYVAPTVPAIPHDTSHLVIPQHMAKPQVTSPMTVDTPWSPMSAISEGPSSIPGLRSPADFDMRDSEVITEQQKPTPLDVFGSAAAARPDSRRGSWNPAFGASSFGTATTQANQGYRGSVASSTDSAYFTANQGYRDSVSSSTGSAYFTANQGYRDSVSSSTGSTYAAPNGAPTDRPLIPTQQPQVSRVRFVPNRYDQSSQGHGPAPNAGGLSGVYLNAGQQSRTTAATLAPNQYGQSTQGHGPAPNTGGIKVPSVAPFYRPIADVLSSFYPKAPQVPQSSQASQETNPFKTHIIGSTQQQSAPSQPRESTFAATLRSAFASFRPGPAPQNGGGGPKPVSLLDRLGPQVRVESPGRDEGKPQNEDQSGKMDAQSATTAENENEKEQEPAPKPIQKPRSFKKLKVFNLYPPAPLPIQTVDGLLLRKVRSAGVPISSVYPRRASWMEIRTPASGAESESSFSSAPTSWDLVDENRAPLSGKKSRRRSSASPPSQHLNDSPAPLPELAPTPVAEELDPSPTVDSSLPESWPEVAPNPVAEESEELDPLEPIEDEDSRWPAFGNALAETAAIPLIFFIVCIVNLVTIVAKITAPLYARYQAAIRSNERLEKYASGFWQLVGLVAVVANIIDSLA